jgi:hypothetical protein
VRDLIVFEAVSSSRHVESLSSRTKCAASVDVSDNFWAFLRRAWWRKVFSNYHLVAHDRPPLYEELRDAMAAGRFVPSDPRKIFDLSTQRDVTIKHLQSMSIQDTEELFEIQHSCFQRELK